ncbi:MAG: hypothetical protein HOP15_05300 [Planctomycetes bacterium]|nr:hypothetical protein [Planctomycetota bacterium]
MAEAVLAPPLAGRSERGSGAGFPGARLLLVFALGTGLGLLTVERFTLPFRNPHGVIAPLVDLGFNPANNVLRYFVVLGCPLVALVLACLSRRFRAGLVARGELAREPSEPARVSTRTWVALLAFAALCGLCAHTYHSEESFDPLHEGEAVGSALSLAAGGAPYADVAIPHGAIQDPLRARAAFRLFGPSIGALRTLESSVKLLAFGLLAILLARLRPRQPSFAFAALGILTLACIPDPLRWGLLVASREVLPCAFLVLTASFLRRVARNGASLDVALVAAALAALVPCAFGYSVDRGFFLLALWLLVLCLVPLRAPSRAHVVKLLAASAAGLLAGVGLLTLLLGDGLGAFAHSAFVHSREVSGLAYGYVYDWTRVEYVAPVVVIAGLVYWIFARLLSRVLRLGWAAGLQQWAAEDSMEFVLVAASAVFYRGALLRPDSEHVRYSLWPAVISLLLVAHEHLAGAPASTRERRVRAALGLASCVLAAFFAVHVATHSRLAANFPLGKPDSEFLTRKLRTVLQALEGELKESDVFANLTNEPGWYYLLNRPAPTSFAELAMAVTSAERQELRDDLVSNGVTVILARAAGSDSIDRYPDARRWPEVHAYVESAFRPVFEHANYRILRREQ